MRRVRMPDLTAGRRGRGVRLVGERTPVRILRSSCSGHPAVARIVPPAPETGWICGRPVTRATRSADPREDTAATPRPGRHGKTQIAVAFSHALWAPARSTRWSGTGDQRERSHRLRAGARMSARPIRCSPPRSPRPLHRGCAHRHPWALILDDLASRLPGRPLAGGSGRAGRHHHRLARAIFPAGRGSPPVGGFTARVLAYLSARLTDFPASGRGSRPGRRPDGLPLALAQAPPLTLNRLSLPEYGPARQRPHMSAIRVTAFPPPCGHLGRWRRKARTSFRRGRGCQALALPPCSTRTVPARCGPARRCSYVAGGPARGRGGPGLRRAA